MNKRWKIGVIILTALLYIGRVVWVNVSQPGIKPVFHSVGQAFDIRGEKVRLNQLRPLSEKESHIIRKENPDQAGKDKQIFEVDLTAPRQLSKEGYSGYTLIVNGYCRVNHLLGQYDERNDGIRYYFAVPKKALKKGKNQFVFSLPDDCNQGNKHFAFKSVR